MVPPIQMNQKQKAPMGIASSAYFVCVCVSLIFPAGLCFLAQFSSMDLYIHKLFFLFILSLSLSLSVDTFLFLTVFLPCCSFSISFQEIKEDIIDDQTVQETLGKSLNVARLPEAQLLPKCSTLSIMDKRTVWVNESSLFLLFLFLLVCVLLT